MGYGGRPRQFSQEQVARALRQSDGVIERAAQALGCHRDTIWRYCVRHPSLRRLQVQLAQGGRERALGRGDRDRVDADLRAGAAEPDAPPAVVVKPGKKPRRPLPFERW